uniref:RiboL-PSP-HEPN domain-containing protein n=1 Tax=Candidatus Kentrum sp. LFY TaxID=2126342 RepID=A0A450U5T1_9GAMM|nr:MAG: hypothetical protein BECKLFY1418B_GA0070995_100422 [Candidatus Kentron sp. LFY]
MNNRAEIIELQRHLDAAFERIGDVTSDNPELQSDLARYLCVLVSGYLEKAVTALLLEHARQAGTPPTLQRFVDVRTRRFTNANTQRLQDLLGSFDPDWERELKSFLVDGCKDAVNSIVGLRNRIAHGETVGITYRQISDYYIQVQKVVDQVAGLCCEN